MNNGKTNYSQVFSRQRENELRIKKLCPSIQPLSGIYCFYRITEDGFKIAYVGQATKNVLYRMAQHLNGYDQHIDKSIRKHKLYDEKTNPYGYKCKVICYCKSEDCNEKEQKYIKEFADNGWQLRNTTIGSQGEGKANLFENKSSKGYFEGVDYGYLKARKYVASLFHKNLTYGINGKDGVLKQKALKKFEDFIKIGDAEDEQTSD